MESKEAGAEPARGSQRSFRDLKQVYAMDTITDTIASSQRSFRDLKLAYADNTAELWQSFPTFLPGFETGRSGRPR